MQIISCMSAKEPKCARAARRTRRLLPDMLKRWPHFCRVKPDSEITCTLLLTNRFVATTTNSISKSSGKI